MIDFKIFQNCPWFLFVQQSKVSWQIRGDFFPFMMTKSKPQILKEHLSLKLLSFLTISPLYQVFILVIQKEMIYPLILTKVEDLVECETINFQFWKDTTPPPPSRSNAQCSCKLKHYMHANNVSHQQRPREHSWWNTHFSVPFFSPQQWQRRLDERTICQSTTSRLVSICNNSGHGRQSGVSY